MKQLILRSVVVLASELLVISSLAQSPDSLRQFPATVVCQRCNLRGVNLNSADLKGANLNGANLSRANLSDANLSLANWNSVVLCNTIGPNQRLSNRDCPPPSERSNSL
jgi:hypothetical protein